MLLALRSHTTHIVRHTQIALASTVRRTRIEPSKPNACRKAYPSMRSADKVINDITAQITECLETELRLQHIEGFIHKCLDKALLSTRRHQRVYEAVIVHLIQSMWPQPAASVYDRMLNKGFISADTIDARMLVILLADTRGSADPVLKRLSAIVSNPYFSHHDLLALLNVAEDYNVRPKFVIALIQTFLRGKGTKYSPPPGIIVTWLRAAVKLGDVELMRDILELPNAALKLSVIAEAWDVADKLDDCLEKLGMRLVGAVANPVTQEDDFLRALQVMKEVGMNEQIVARVCASYLANRDANYIPKIETARAAIEAFVQVDMIEEAFDLLYRVGIQPGERPVHRTFLANLRDSRPLDHHSFAKLLTAIDAGGISLDTSLLNILISREVRLKRVVNALSLFKEMKNNPHLPPDSHTFGSLFSMYRRIRPCSIRRYVGAKTTAPTYPLRELFNELLQRFKSGENPVRPNTSLLNAALKAFMRQRDYAGAIVVIKSYGIFQVPLDNKSYYGVMKLLIRRVWAEVRGRRPKNAERWVDRFLGVQHYTDIILNKSLVHEIISVLRRKDFDVSMPIHVPVQSRRHRLMRHLRQRSAEDDYYPFPTMQMMESLVPPEPADFIYDPVPLIRVLSRAVYADAIVRPEEASQRIDELVRNAEVDMITPHLAPFYAQDSSSTTITTNHGQSSV